MYHSVVKVKKNLGPEFFTSKFNLQYCVLGIRILMLCITMVTILYMYVHTYMLCNITGNNTGMLQLNTTINFIVIIC